MKYFGLLIAIVIAFGGCISHDKLISYKDNFPTENNIVISNPPVIKIQSNDVLQINVYTDDIATTEPYNLNRDIETSAFSDVATIQLNGYLVDADGYIDFPVLGRLKVNDLTTTEAKELLLGKLRLHLKDPVVNIRFLNFRITVSGEVQNPGAFTIFNERISLPEVLSLAGGLSDHADMSRILIVRELDGKRSFARVNMHSANLFQSKYFYLHQNDLIYVEPLKSKTGSIQDQSSKTIPVITTAATLIAVLVSILQNKK